MKLSNLIFTKILFIFFLSLGINYAWAQAPIIHPSSILGKKFTFGGLPILVLVNETLTTKVQDLNTGEWKDESYVWETSDTTATLYLDGNSQEKDKVLKLTFTSNTGGTVEVGKLGYGKWAKYS